jgi:hypothetical protein
VNEPSRYREVFSGIRVSVALSYAAGVRHQCASHERAQYSNLTFHLISV